MLIKKYEAKTEKEAILLAQNELGKEAIVMNIRTIQPKGVFRFFRNTVVEVTAAVDETNGTEQIKKQTFEKAMKATIKETKVEAVQKEETTTYAIEEKLNQLQQLLEEQMIGKMEAITSTETTTEESEHEYLTLIRQQLEKNEVDKEHIDQIFSEVQQSIHDTSSIDDILAKVYQKIVLKLGNAQTITLEEGKTKFVFFIGPTGVGKTTSIAKIASTFKLSKDANIGFITLDTYRIAAVEQLRTYANILGSELKVVYTYEEMQQAKEDFLGYDLVLVDTAGRSHKNKEQCDDLKKILACVEDEQKETYLVLSATTKYADLMRIIATYHDITDFRILFTKLDETVCLGNILNVKMITDAPLSYTAWGQNVPDDIGGINPQQITRQLLGGEK